MFNNNWPYKWNGQPQVISRVGYALLMVLVLQGSLWAAQSPYSLYTDRKGKQVGDLVTILIYEAAKAQNDTRTETDEQSSAGVEGQAGSGWLSWIPGLGAKFGSDAEYNGKGRTSRNGELRATVSARIVKVLDNGNLLIEGVKLVTVNEEEEILEVSGMIRPEDINPDNTILSSKLAEAVIRYSGSGDISNAQKQGVVTRFFHWLF
jgi:flagellar L-ring protein FlgH